MDPSGRDDARELDPDSVLAKILVVLTAFTVDDHVVTLADLGRRTTLPKSTLHRLCQDLVVGRLLDRVDGGYRLGGRLFEIGMRASVERRLVDVATPFMEDLYELTHETVHLGVREGSEVVYVAKIGGHSQVAAPSRVGGRLPLHCTAIGKTLLAYAPPDVAEQYLAGPLARRTPRTVIGPGLIRQQLDRIRETGVAFEYEESAVGLVCIASPILGSDGDIVSALSLTGPVTRFDPRRTTGAIRAAATGIQSTLAHQARLRDLASQ